MSVGSGSLIVRDAKPGSTPLDTLTDRYIRERRTVGRWNEGSCKKARGVLRSLWAALDAKTVDELECKAPTLAMPIADLAPETQYKYLCIARGFVAWLVDSGAAVATLLDATPSGKKVSVAILRRQVDIEGVLAVASRRERVVVALMGFAGLRPIEVCRLRWSDLNFSERTMRLVGKAGHERVVNMFEAFDVLQSSLDRHSLSSNFVVPSKRGWAVGVEPSTVGREARTAFHRVQVQIYPRALRREATRRREAAGDSLDQLAAQFGHKSIETLGRYLPTEPADRPTVEGRDYGNPGTPLAMQGLPETIPMQDSFRQPRLRRHRPPRKAVVSERRPARLLVERFLSRRRYATQEGLGQVAGLLNDFVLNVDPIERDGIVEWLAGKRWAASTMRKNLSVLRRFVAELAATGVLDRDPMAGIAPPKVPRRVPRTLSQADCADLVASISDATTRTVCVFALQQALGAAAIARLNIEDFDLKGMTYARDGRRVPLSAESIAAISKHIRSERRTRGPLIAMRDGRRASAQTIARRMRNACDKADLPGGTRAIVETAIAGIVNSGASLHVVRDAVGHTDLLTTLKRTRPALGRTGLVSNAWPLELGHDSAYLDRHEAARVLGVSTTHVLWLARKVDAAGERDALDHWLLRSEELQRMHKYRLEHPYGGKLQAPKAVVDKIVQHVNDERSFAWIAKRFRETGVPTPGKSPWTAKHVSRLYRRRTDAP